MAEIRRILIWSGWLRLSHWALALSTLVLLISGWLIANSPLQATQALEYHYLATSVLIFGLVLRIAIFVRGKPHEKLAALFPQPGEFSGIKQTTMFYLSMARRPLPHWYAHNPLWKMVYVFVYVILLLLLFSGTMMDSRELVLGFYLPGVHAFWADFIAWFVLLHVIALFVHDYFGKTTDMSAMVNGFRLFEVDSGTGDTAKGTPVVVQSMDSLLKGKYKDANSE